MNSYNDNVRETVSPKPQKDNKFEEKRDYANQLCKLKTTICDSLEQTQAIMKERIKEEQESQKKFSDPMSALLLVNTLEGAVDNLVFSIKYSTLLRKEALDAQKALRSIQNALEEPCALFDKEFERLSNKSEFLCSLDESNLDIYANILRIAATQAIPNTPIDAHAMLFPNSPLE